MPHEGNNYTNDSFLPGVPIKKYLTAKELSVYLGIPLQRIYVLTHTKGIPVVKLGRTVLFDRLDIEAWLKTKRYPMAEDGDGSI